MNFNVIDEQYPGKVVGVYNNGLSAKQIVEHLSQKCGFLKEQLNVVPPEDTNFEKKVEPDDKGIARTLLKSHLVLGGIGLISGLLISGALVFAGPAVTASSPVMAILAAGMIGAFLGLLVAGAVSLRPDHDAVIKSTRDATDHRQWSVIVHTKNDDEIETAKKVMQPLAVKLSESF